MDRLWTPWRYRYVAQDARADAERGECVFCRILDSGSSDRENLIVHRAEDNFVILNRFPYAGGHAMVIPYAHLDTLAALPAPTLQELAALTQKLEGALRSLYKPDGMNIGMNIGRAAGAGVAGHVHMHAVPRWIGDANFASVIGETRIVPEELDVTWQRLAAAFR